MSSGFEDMLSGIFGDSGTPMPPPTARATARPLPAIRGKEIGGVLYVRADDVADALEAQAPTSCARLIAKLRRPR